MRVLVFLGLLPLWVLPVENLGAEQGQQGPTVSQPARIESLQQAVAQNPKDVNVRMELGKALSDSGDLEGAIAQFREVIRLDSGSPTAHHNLGVIYVRMRNWEAAESPLREAVKLAPENWVTHYLLGVTMAHRNDRREAFRQFQEAIRRGGTEVAGMPGLFNIPEAAEEFRRAGEDAAAHFLVGWSLSDWSLRDSRNPSGAREEFREASRIDPQFALPHLFTAFLYREEGDMVQVRSALEVAARLNPVLVKAFLERLLKQ